MNNTKTIEEYRIVNDLREHQAPVQSFDLVEGVAFEYEGKLYIKPPVAFYSTHEYEYNAILIDGWKAVHIHPYDVITPVTMTINITP